MAEASKCPHCGKPVPAGAPGGLCPECLVKVGIGSEAGSPGTGPKRPAPAPPSLEDIARHFPQLEILELLGTGGMGAVYKARQREIDRLVALKILPSESASDPGFAERFTREARALAKLNHPNIVALHEFGHVDGLHYFMMEFVDGLNLRQLEQAGRLSAREALQIIPQICEALQFAHDEGIVHRDIKPENVLLDKKGRVKIADFGLARILGHEPEDFRLTRAREVMGTPHYMAPEQVETPQSVDHRADIFSLGVVFYEMLTGELPLGKFAPPSQKVQIDVRLDEVVLRALEKEPARRYQQASEVKTDMETIITHQPELARSPEVPVPTLRSRVARLPRVGILVAAMLSLAVILAWVWWRAHLEPLTPPATEETSSTPAAPGADADSAQTASKAAFAQRYGLGPGAVVPSSSAPETNADTPRSITDAFARRYGLGPVPAPKGPPTNGASPEEAVAQREVSVRPQAASPAGNPGVPAAFAARYGLRGGAPSPAPSGTNANFTVTASGTAPLSYQWRFDTNSATAASPAGLVITKLTPLYLKLTLDNAMILDSGPHFVIGVQQDASANPKDRAKRQYYVPRVTTGTNGIFTLLSAKAPPDNPTNVDVVLELKDSGERVTVSRDFPFQRLDGYMANLSYEPEKKTWTNRRVGSLLKFDGNEVEILAITQTNVVLGAKSSGKKWAIELKGPPADQSSTPGNGGSPNQP